MNALPATDFGCAALCETEVERVILSDPDKAALRRIAWELDPCLMMRDLGLTPDPWQERLLLAEGKRQIVLSTRQAGKSVTTAVKALHKAIFNPGALILITSPSEKQSKELFIKLTRSYKKLKPLGATIDARNETALSLWLENDSRIIALPDNPDTIRCFSEVAMLIVDEAAMASDALFTAVSPMLAVSQGQMVLLSTPKGKRGYFYTQFLDGGPVWERTFVHVKDCPRITPEFLATERLTMSAAQYRQEYECSFEEDASAFFDATMIYAAFEEVSVEVLTMQEGLYDDQPAIEAGTAAA